MHISAVERAGFHDLIEGQKIKFDLVTDPRKGKISAENLKLAEVKYDRASRST